MLQVGLKQPESMQSKIPTRRGQLAHPLHAPNIRQIACKYLRQIICKTTLVLAAVPPESREGEPLALTPAQVRLRKMVLDAVTSPHSKRNYARALDDLFAFCASRPLSRELLMEWRSTLESLSPSTINVRLSAVRKMVGEARRAGMIGQEEAASLTDIPNISQKGVRLGNWLSREQAKELLAVPDRATLKGKRDYVILALLVGCALRRNELAELDVETIQQREGRWVLADLEGKADGSAPSPSRSGLSTASMPG
jgi:integrase